MVRIEPTVFRGTCKHRFTTNKERSPLISEPSWKEPQQEDLSKYVISGTVRKPPVKEGKAILLENVATAD
jgi:hypothetical protein